MSVAVEAPPGTDVSRETTQDRPLFVPPTTADREARRADPRPMPADPEAPYGYMVDRKTGETRARKTAGRQPTTTRRPAQAPKRRAANRPRVAASKPDTPAALEPVAPVAPPDHREQVDQICQGAWMIGAAIPMPVPGRKFLGINLHAVAVRIKVQGHVIGTGKDVIAQHVGTMADRIPAVARRVEWLTAEDGWGWMIPVTIGLVGVLAASQAVWSTPVDQLAPTAALVDKQYADFIQENAALIAQQQQAPADVSRETSGVG